MREESEALGTVENLQVNAGKTVEYILLNDSDWLLETYRNFRSAAELESVRLRDAALERRVRSRDLIRIRSRNQRNKEHEKMNLSAHSRFCNKLLTN
jgi:hypothetical protein